MKIYTLQVLINRIYLLHSNNAWIMVDAGYAGSRRKIRRWLKKLDIAQGDLKLLVLTHAHFDHAGAAGYIRELTGTKIVVHKDDLEMLEKGIVRLPTGATPWGRIGAFLLRMFSFLIRMPSASADIVIGDEGLSLEAYGMKGRIVHTPGHTPGSISLILDNGDAFVGCMAHANKLFRSSPGLPIFAEDIPALKGSWEKILNMGVKTIYPGHGNSFSADIIRRQLEDEWR